MSSSSKRKAGEPSGDPSAANPRTFLPVNCIPADSTPVNLTTSASHTLDVPDTDTATIPPVPDTDTATIPPVPDTDTATIPPELNQLNPRKWKRGDVKKYLEANKEEYDLEDEDITRLYEERVSGRVLLLLTEEKLTTTYGLHPGTASIIELLINALTQPQAVVKATEELALAQESQPHPHRQQRWEELNQVLATSKRRRVKLDDVSYSTVFSYSKWSEVGPIFERDTRKYTENVLPIPDSDLEVLSKVLSWVYKSYSERLLFTSDCESKRIHLIAPILWSVVQLLPNTKVDVEKDFDGNRVHAHGHFEFVLIRGSKRICIVEAKKEQFEQGAAQCLLGCEVAADLDNTHEVFGIVTNFEKWVFLKSLDNEILVDEYNTLTFINDMPHRAQLSFVVGKLYSLLL